MRITNETKVGIFTVAAMFILVMGYSYMQGMQFFTPSNTYVAVYENVDGLKSSNPVLLNGYQVGKVSSIDMYRGEGDFKILVKFSVNRDVKIRKSSIAKIINYDLLGAKAIDLIPGKEGEMAAHHDTLKAEREMGLTESVNQLLAPVKQRTENLITSVDTMVNTMQNIIETAQIETIFRSMRSAIASLESASGRIDTIVGEEGTRLDRIFADIESISSNLRAHNQEMGNIFANFSTLSDSLVAADIKATLDRTSSTINEVDSIIKKLGRGEGTAGKLLTDDELYYRLNEATNSLDRLTNDIRNNPRRYLNMSLINFGRDRGGSSSEDEKDKKKEKD